MANFIIIFFALTLTSRLFSETLGVAPKALDLLDLLVIPVLLLLSLARPVTQRVDTKLHRRVLTLTGLFVLICTASIIVNYERVHYGPILLYLFGMLEGPILFLSLNKLVTNTRTFSQKISRFINVMVLVEIAAVLMVSAPIFIATGDPDKVSGTFGNNPYQFSVFLVIIGGFFLGRQRLKKISITTAVVVQVFILVTFILMQYRSAVLAFFLSYAIVVTLLYGRQLLRLVAVVILLAGVAYYAFDFVERSNFRLKYGDLLVLAENPEMLMRYGKLLAYANTVEMYGQYPHMMLFGSGPGTYVSRANYTFTIETRRTDKGVGQIITTIFGDRDYETDVQVEYILPLYRMEIAFGSFQVNNPNSSILALAAEAGLPGLALFVLLYGTVIGSGIRNMRRAVANDDNVLLPLASAQVIGVIYLCLIAPLDNYLEIARVTLPIWLIFWTTSALAHNRRLEHAAKALEAYTALSANPNSPEPKKI